MADFGTVGAGGLSVGQGGAVTPGPSVIGLALRVQTLGAHTPMVTQAGLDAGLVPDAPLASGGTTLTGVLGAMPTLTGVLG